MREQVLWSATIVVVIAIIACSALKGCSNQNDNYYALASQCVQSGGSWVDTYAGLCIHGRP